MYHNLNICNFKHQFVEGGTIMSSLCTSCDGIRLHP